MPVPYMARTMRGWTKATTVIRITQSVVDHETTESRTEITLKANFQPMPARVVNRKPEDQRSWDWWSIIVTEGPYLNTDEIIVKDNYEYRIESGNDWSESGFQKYEAVRNYVEPST